MFLHLVNQVMLGRIKVFFEEALRRSHSDGCRTVQAEVVLVAELKLSRQKRLPVLTPSLLKQVVNISENIFSTELVQIYRGNGLDSSDHLGDAVGLGEGEQGGVGAHHHRENAPLSENFISCEGLSDSLEWWCCVVEGGGDGESWQDFDVRGSFDSQVSRGAG